MRTLLLTMLRYTSYEPYMYALPGLLRGYICRCAPGLFRGCICMCFSGFLEVVYIMSALSFTGACAYTSELAFDVGIGFIYNGDSI